MDATETDTVPLIVVPSPGDWIKTPVTKGGLLTVTAVLLTPYPPGIPLLIPGERFNKTIVQYLQFARAFNEGFPGFETDIHGLVEERTDSKTHYYMDCVRKQSGGAPG